MTPLDQSVRTLFLFAFSANFSTLHPLFKLSFALGGNTQTLILCSYAPQSSLSMRFDGHKKGSRVQQLPTRIVSSRTLRLICGRSRR